MNMEMMHPYPSKLTWYREGIRYIKPLGVSQQIYAISASVSHVRHPTASVPAKMWGKECPTKARPGLRYGVHYLYSHLQ